VVEADGVERFAVERPPREAGAVEAVDAAAGEALATVAATASATTAAGSRAEHHERGEVGRTTP
jgi:hypothetical protein